MAEQPQTPLWATPTPPTAAVPPPTSERPSAWSTPLGVIAIVFGAGGMLMYAWSAIFPLVLPALLKVLPQQQQASLAVTQQWQTWTVSSSMVAVCLAALLLAGGIGLLKRRPSARTLCMTWSVLKIVFVVAQVLVGRMIQKDMLEAMRGQPPVAGAPGAGTIMETAAAAGMCFSLLWGWALPVFLLIWFSRSRIKGDVTGWRVAAGP